MDLWDGVKGFLKSSVPMLANAIIPGAGGIASEIVSSVLGCDNTPAAIEEGLKNATPEQLQALKNEANRHAEKLRELAMEQEKMFLQDKQSARQREMAIVQATGKRDIFLPLFTLVITVGFFGLLYMLTFKTVPDENIQMINIMLGTLGTCFVGANTYYFGTSKSSSDKNKMLLNR